MEVFLLGILVAMVKLIKLAEIRPGLGLYAFLVLVFLLAAIAATMQPEHIWEQAPMRR
jgi:paraquat-inducible protein A